MSFFGKKEAEIIKLFAEHLGFVDDTLSSLARFLNALKAGDKTSVDIYSEEVHNSESKADCRRRDTESAMYSGAFLPNFRGDLLGLAEAFDKVANKAEAVVDEILLQHLEIPDVLMDDFIVLVDLSHETYRSVRSAAEKLFEDLESVDALVKMTEDLEHQEDDHERALIKKIFDMELTLAEKRELRQLALTIGSIANHSEDCSDRIRIITLKRRT